MHRKLFVLFMSFILSLTTCVCAFAASPRQMLPESIRKSGVIRVGSQQTYPPIEYKDTKTGKVIGLSAELLEEIARRLGVKIQWVQSDYGALITGSRAGRFDLVSGGISDQIERERELDFVNYMKAGTAILIERRRVPEFWSIKDFSGRKVAFTLGAKKIEEVVRRASDELVAEGREPIEIVMLPNTADAKMQLDLGRVDGYLNESFTLAHMMKQIPGKYTMVRYGYYSLTNLITSWGFAKKDAALRDAVRTAAQNMLDDGTFEEIVKKWNLESGLLPEITINTPWELRGEDDDEFA